MNWTECCAAILPCWNEAGTIANLVREVRNHLPTVFVVNDGSTDATAERAAAAGARVLGHPANFGKGAALRTGLGAATQAGFRWAMTLDGDAQHAPQCIPSFLGCAEHTGAALVIGNRFAAGGAMPVVRRTVNRWMSRLISRRAGLPLPDSQCGFRLVHLGTWAQLPLRTDHFEVESECLLAFLAVGARVEFVPVPVVASSRPSRIRAGPDTLRWLRWWQASREGRPALTATGAQPAAR